MSSHPSPNGSNGRSADGRFAKGNPGGPGNPLAKRSAAIRSIMLETVTEEDLREIVLKLVALAKAGDLSAIREVLDRLIGKAKTGVEMDSENLPEAPRPIEEVVAEIKAVLGIQPAAER